MKEVITSFARTIVFFVNSVMLNWTCFKSSSSRHIASRRIHGELAVKEALMSNFLTEFGILLCEKEGILELLN